jgi:hypothetical protein
MNTGYEPKNKIVPHIIKDFFTKEELDTILHIVENQKIDESIPDFYKPLILPDMSRMQIEVMYPVEIKEKLEKLASELVGEDVSMNHNSYLSYSLEHGDGINPKLPVHYDSDNYYSMLTMDYQLYKNINWKICIEEESFDLEYGDLLIFWGAGQVHWRDPILFKDGDKTEVLTMHFSRIKDHEELNKASRNKEARDKRLATWKQNPAFASYSEKYQKKNELVLGEKSMYEKIKKHAKKNKKIG